MACYYLLTAATKHAVRKFLKQLNTLAISYSSIYYLDENSDLCLVLSLDHQVDLPVSGHGLAINHCQATSTPENSHEFLSSWAIAEIEQNLTFIKYEAQAKTNKLGCHIDFGKTKITRSFQPLTEQMLIVNNTPDSFSEQGKLYERLDMTLALVEESLQRGVSIIDVGGESTRPGASRVSDKEEMARLKPLILEIAKLKKYHNFKLSLDSYQETTISNFIEQIDIVNDVSGNLGTNLLRQIARRSLTYIPMHSLTVPVDKNISLPLDQDPIEILLSWGQSKLDQLAQLGFNAEQVILDIGIGFNKTQSQSWYLLKNIRRFHRLGVELLVGHSRKSFLNKVSSQTFDKRDLETAIISDYLSRTQIDYLRVHNIDCWERIYKVNNQLYTNKTG